MTEDASTNHDKAEYIPPTVETVGKYKLDEEHTPARYYHNNTLDGCFDFDFVTHVPCDNYKTLYKNTSKLIRAVMGDNYLKSEVRTRVRVTVPGIVNQVVEVFDDYLDGTIPLPSVDIVPEDFDFEVEDFHGQYPLEIDNPEDLSRMISDLRTMIFLAAANKAGVHIDDADSRLICDDPDPSHEDLLEYKDDPDSGDSYPNTDRFPH